MLNNILSNKVLPHVILFFIPLNFIDRDYSNYVIIFILLLSSLLIVSKDKFEKANKIFIYLSILFVISALVINFIHNDNISSMDNYSRLLLLLPIYLLFSKILIMPALFFKYVQASIYIAFFVFLYETSFFEYEGRYMGTSSTSITFANLLMTLNIFTLLEIIERSKSNKTNTLFYISRLITIIISFYLWSETQSRGALIGYIFALIYILFIYEKSFKYILLSLALIIPTILVSGVYDRILNTYASLQSIHISKMKDSIEFNTSENERIYYFKFAIDKMYNYPLIGIGSDNFESIMKNDLEKEGIAINARSHAHNDFLDIGSKYGLITLVFFITMLAYLFYFFLKHRNYIFARIGLAGLLLNVGFMLTQSQLAHHQATVVFIILIYISLSQIRRHSGINSI